MSINRSYYHPSDLKRIPDLIKLAPQTAASYFAFVSIHASRGMRLQDKILEVILTEFQSTHP